MHTGAWTLTICLIFGTAGHVLAAAAAAKNGCSITMPTDLPKNEPVLLYAANAKAMYSLFRPTGQVTELAKGSRLQLLCADKKNTIEALNQQSVVLYCGANGKFATVDGDQQYELKDLGCTSIPGSVLRVTETACANGKGKVYEAGFELPADEFATVFFVCYDSSTETAYFSKNVINGAAIDYSVTEGTRRAFRADGMRFTTTATNTLYTTKNQIARFEALLGATQPFVNAKSFLARGHLAPDADFVFSYEQLATYFYTNCAPEFQIVNSGNWIRVENLARSLASQFGDDLDIWTGTMGVLKLSNGAKKNVEISLDKSGLVQAPLHYFKVIKHIPTNEAIVMITVNNPFAEKSEITELCDNVCAKAGVANEIFADTSRGYTYCCELSAFKKIYPHLPSTLTAAKLLTAKA